MSFCIWVKTPMTSPHESQQSSTYQLYLTCLSFSFFCYFVSQDRIVCRWEGAQNTERCWNATDKWSKAFLKLLMKGQSYYGYESTHSWKRNLLDDQNSEASAGKENTKLHPILSKTHLCGVLAVHLPTNTAGGFTLPCPYQMEAVESLTLMKLEGIMRSEISQTERDKYCTASCTRGTLK